MIKTKKRKLTTEEFNKKLEEKNELIKKHHFVLWLILFCPIALYKSFKYKILPKWLNIIIIICVLVLSIVSVDVVLNPSRVLDNKVEKELELYIEQLGTIINIEKYSNTTNYYIYDVISSNGRYDVYIDSTYKIKAIKQIDLSSKNIYISEDFEEQYKDIYSEIIRFINNNEINIDNQIKEVISTSNNSQVLKIGDKEYIFEISFENVDKIYENNNLIYENEQPSLRLNQEIFNKVTKKFPQTKNIDYASTIIFNDNNYEIYFYTKEGDLYQLIIYESGKIIVNTSTFESINKKEEQ